MTNKTQDTTQLERVVKQILKAQLEIWEQPAVHISVIEKEEQEKKLLTKTLTTYAQTVAEEAVREEKKRIFQEYNVSRKESKKEKAQSNTWNDLMRGMI